MQDERANKAKIVADQMNKQSCISDIQICTYAMRHIFRKGTSFVARGSAIYPVRKNGKLGDALILGSFKAYPYV